MTPEAWVSLRWTPEDREIRRVEWALRRDGLARAGLASIGLGVMLPVGAVVSSTGRFDLGPLAVAATPGLLLLLPLSLLLGFWYPDRRRPRRVEHAVDLGAAGLTLCIGTVREHLAWRSITGQGMRAGHLFLYRGAHAPLCIPGRILPDGLEGQVVAWRKPRVGPEVDRRQRWEVHAVVESVDWSQQARDLVGGGVGGWLAGLRHDAAARRDPDLWPVGPLEVVFTAVGGELQDSAGARRFLWSDVSGIETTPRAIVLRLRASPPVLLPARSLQAMDLLAGALHAWHRRPVRPPESTDNPYSAPRIK